MTYLKLKDLNNKLVTFKKIFPGQYTSFEDGKPVRKDEVTNAEKYEKAANGYNKWSFGIGTVVVMDNEEYGLSLSAAQMRDVKITLDVTDDMEIIDNTVKVIVDKKGERTAYKFSVPKASKSKEEIAADIENLPF